MKILVTLDGSEESLAVVPVVEKLARRSGAAVVLLTVCGPAKGTYLPPERLMRPAVSMQYVLASTVSGAEARREAPLESVDQATERALAEATDFLEGQARPLREAGVAVETRVAMADDIAAAILEAAKAEAADLIAMATHGRSGLRELVQGSVASAVVRAGELPVLLVRPRARGTAQA